MGCSPWGREESDTTERLHFHFSLSCIGEGNGNPLQCSCLENPRDGGAWQAAVYGVAQSQTQLKRLHSNNILFMYLINFAFLGRGWLSSKEPACNVGDLGSIPGFGRSPGEGKGYPLQYSGLENSMDCMVHEVAKSWTQLSNFHFQAIGWQSFICCIHC